MDDDDLYSPFWGHVEDLRYYFLKALSIIVVGVILSFACYQPIIAFLTAPLESIDAEAVPKGLHRDRLETVRIVNSSDTPMLFSLPEEALKPNPPLPSVEEITDNTYRIAPKGQLLFSKPVFESLPLVVLSPLEGVLTALKVSFWIGFVGTSPFWLFVFLQFIIPALKGEEKALVYPFLLTSSAFILGGICFAFFVTVPIANQYLVVFNQTIGTNLWSLERYLDYTLFLLLANGFAFELGAVGIFSVHLGLVSARALVAGRRFAIVGAFILGALLTPPDVLTQLMLAIPLMLLYEGLILFAKCTERNC